MIKDINAITPEYMKYRIEQETGQYKQEIERIHSIIKEVREYIEAHIKYECDDAFNGKQFYSYHLYDFDKKELLEILDKTN